MKRIIILLVLAVLSTKSFAQKDSLINSKKNEIKWDIFNTILITSKSKKNAFQFFYERFLNRQNHSIQVSVAINDKYGFWDQYSFFDGERFISHDTYSKSISLGYNFLFPFKNNFSSFSFFPLIKGSFQKDLINDPKLLNLNKVIENRFSIAGGLGVANKWIWMDKLSYQIFVTGSKSILKAKSKYQIIENRFEPKVGVNLGFRF
jgi:hypothetical protein